MTRYHEPIRFPCHADRNFIASWRAPLRADALSIMMMSAPALSKDDRDDVEYTGAYVAINEPPFSSIIHDVYNLRRANRHRLI